MSSSFNVKISVELPVEVYQPLWSTWRHSDLPKVRAEYDAAAEATFEAIQTSDPEH